MSAKRGYYRIPRKNPANRIEGPLAELVRAKFIDGWPKARIARELRLNRRTVIRICGSVARQSELPAHSSLPVLAPLIRCIGCGIEIRRSILRAHWPYCPAVREGHLSLNDCPS